MTDVRNDATCDPVTVDTPPTSIARSQSTESKDTRGSWGSGLEFLLSCIGLSVGLGNVWRFPYLCHKHGGGSFLFPYLILLTIAGRPMYFMELVIGQFGGVGPLSVWKLAPIMKGVGIAMIICSSVVCIYYNVLMAYALYYISQSFQSVLPWTTCDWMKQIDNATNCVVKLANQSSVTFGSNSTSAIENGTSASQLFWDRKVLDISDGIETLGGIKWDLALALAISWLIVCGCLARGVKTSGKVVYFAATFPYVILISLLVASLTRPGAWDGLRQLFTFDFERLKNFELWQDAASQMFYSLGVAMGGLTMYASYNDFRHNIFRDAYIVSVVDTFTSVIAGMVVFSVIGILSHDLGVDMGHVIRGGPGLAFVAYPQALSLLPLPQLWSVLFFFMLYMLGLDSEFAMLESVVASLADEIPFIAKHRTKCTFAFGLLFFACGLVLVTRGGQFVFEIFDNYGGSLPLTFLAIFECIGIIWVYGYNNFVFDIDFMLNRKIGIYWKITWKYTAPIFLSFVIVATMCTYQPTKFENYDFPRWADALGWMLTLFILLPIPLWAIYEVLRQKSGASLVDKIKLASHESENWGPKNPELRKHWRVNKTYLNAAEESARIKQTPQLKKSPMRMISIQSCVE